MNMHTSKHADFSGSQRADKTALPPLAPGAAMRWETVRSVFPQSCQSVLEIGCGRGAFAARLAHVAGSVTALEPDLTSYKQARDFAGRNVDVRNCKVEDLPAGTRFDAVCAFEVIEHLADDLGAMRSWADRLKPGGTVIISAPAHQNRFGAWDEMVGHFRRYDAADMHALLSGAGLSDINIRHYGFPAGPVLETVRNQIAKRKLSAVKAENFETRTASSARQLQPEGKLGPMMKIMNPLLCSLSNQFPNRGVGLVATAVMPK